MTAPEDWYQGVRDTVDALIEKLATLNDVELASGVLAAATLWPVRARLLALDEPYIDALQALVGGGTGRVLSVVKGWKGDAAQASRDLGSRADADPELKTALAALVTHFGVAAIFADRLSRHYAPQLGDNVFHVNEQIKAALVNIGGVTTIQSLTVELDLPPITLSPPAKLAWYWYLAIVVGLVAALGVIAQMVQPLVEAPKPMTGGFNIAVASFGVLDEGGEVVASQAGDFLAESVYKTIDSQLNEVKQLAGYNIQRLPPSEIGRIPGRTQQERARAAARLASERNIDLIVYGTLAPGEEVTSFTPEFYLSPRTLQNAEELAGQYRFGATLETPGDVRRNPVVTKELSEQLSIRTGALAQFVVGLGYYAIRQFDAALQHFATAEQVEGWDDADGKEVLYLFLGNATSRRPSPNQALALQHYERALTLNPEYARALIGRGEITFLEARGETCEQSRADVDGLRTAQQDFVAALDARDQPAEAMVQGKANFGTGRVLLCLSRAGAEASWDGAERSFQAVVVAYQQSKSLLLRELATEAHANLGLLNWIRPAADNDATAANYQRAIDEYQAAFELSPSRQRQALFKGQMAQLYDNLGDYASADAAFDEAVALDPERVEQYRALQQSLQAMRSSQ